MYASYICSFDPRIMEHVANLLGALSLGLKDAIDRTLNEITGLGGEAPAGLITVGSRPGRSIQHLRETLGLSHSGTVRLVDRLEERGWLRRAGTAGGREVQLALTPSGKEVFREMLAARQAILEQALEPLPPVARSALADVLVRMLEAMPGSRQEAWHVCRLCDHGACRGPGCPVGSGAARREGLP